MEILSRIMNCNKKTITSLIYEEILAGASQNGALWISLKFLRS